MNENSYPKSISPNDLEPIVTRDLNSADEVRATALDGLLTLRRAKAGALAREQSRLTAKYGANDPRVVQATARITANEMLLQGVAIESERARTDVPSVDESTYAVYGYVYAHGSPFKGVADLTVAIYDASGIWMRQFGYACTDARGYFALIIKTGAATLGRVDDTGGTFVPPSSLILHVIDRSNKTLFIDKTPLAVTPRTTEYRRIVLGMTTSSCAPPGNADQPGPPVAPKIAPASTKSSVKATETQKPRSIKKTPRKGK